MELECLRELIWESNLSNRIKEANLNLSHRYHLKEVMGEAEYEEFQKIDPNAISDDELFD
mgnify:CR=1 FL=1